jgi:hypothetical protein
MPTGIDRGERWSGLIPAALVLNIFMLIASRFRVSPLGAETFQKEVVLRAASFARVGDTRDQPILGRGFRLRLRTREIARAKKMLMTVPSETIIATFTSGGAW